MLYSYQMTSFEPFIFFESKNFESLDRDYFKVVFRPVSQEEIQLFYNGKLKNLSKAIAILMEHSSESSSLILRHLEAYMLPPETMQVGL